MQKIDTQIVNMEENNKNTKIRLLKECEAERNLYFEECSHLKAEIK